MDRFKKYVEANIDNADLATLVEWKRELNDDKIINEINNQIKKLVERSTYDFKWLNNASYEDFIKLTKGLDNYDEFLTKTYGEKFKAEYNRQKGLREGNDRNPLRLSYYSPDKRKYANQSINIIQKPDIPYRNRLRIRSSASAYETSGYDINNLFFLSDNPYYGKYEIGLKRDGQNLLNKLNSAFVEKKRHILFRLKMEHNDFLKGKSGQYVNIYTFDKMGLNPTFNDELLKKVLHPVDNQGYQKWKKWIKSAQETYASYPVWDPRNLGYQNRNRISGDYTEDDKNLFDLLKENIKKIIEEDKKEESTILKSLLEENKLLVNKIDDITRELKKQRQEEEERIRRDKQREEKNKKELEKIKETKTDEELEIQKNLQETEQELNMNINILQSDLKTFKNDKDIKKLSEEKQNKFKEKLQLQLSFIKKQQKSMKNRKQYDIPMVIPMSKMNAYIDIKKEIKSLTKEIQLVKKQIIDKKTKVDKENDELRTKKQLIQNSMSINKEREKEIKKLDKQFNEVINKMEKMHNIPSVSLDNLSENEKESKLKERADKIDKYSKKLTGEDKKKWTKLVTERNNLLSKIEKLEDEEKKEEKEISDQEIKDVEVIIKPLKNDLNVKSSERMQKFQELEEFKTEIKNKYLVFKNLMKSFVESGEDLKTLKDKNKGQLAEFTKLFEDEVKISLLEIEYQNIVSEEKTEEEIIETKKDTPETNEASQNEADKSDFISDDDGGSEEDYDSVDENTIQETPVKANTIQEAVRINDKDDGIPVASVKPVELPVAEAKELEDVVGRLRNEDGWWVITELGERTYWKEIIGEKIEQDVLKKYAADIVKQNDLNTIEQMVKSKNINIDLIENFSRQILQEKASNKKLEAFGVSGRSTSDDIKKALLLQALLSAASKMTNNQAVVLKPESDFSDFDYDEFTDEEYGEWKDSSDTGSYMSD